MYNIRKEVESQIEAILTIASKRVIPLSQVQQLNRLEGLLSMIKSNEYEQMCLECDMG